MAIDPLEAKVVEIDGLDATIRVLIQEYLNGNRTLHHVAKLTMKMHERCFACEALEKMRAEVLADWVGK